jgi:hypothetical protein
MLTMMFIVFQKKYPKIKANMMSSRYAMGDVK